MAATGRSESYVKSMPRDYADHAIVIAWRKLSYYWGTLLLIFSLMVVLYGIGKGWNNPPWNVDDGWPALDIVVFLVMMCWIALLEGCQISIVGLQDVDPEIFKESYPRAYRCCKWVHEGPNVERFLVGRQFLLLFNGFVASRLGGGTDVDYHWGDWYWNDAATSFFYTNNVLLMIVIVAGFQLPTQLVAADKMLGFFDLPFAHYYTVVAPCMIVESVGLTHSSYLLKDLLCKLTGIDPNAADPKKAMVHDAMYYIKCFISCAAVIFSFTFLIKGLALNQTNATNGPGWEDLPAGAAIVISLLFLFVMACAEGLQVSALALALIPASDYKDTHPLAYRTCQLVFAGRNMQAFLVGRQFLVAMMMVLLARVTSYAGSDGILVTGTDWGFGTGFNEGLLQSGILGAVLVVNVAQLASQVTASIFPAAFINNHLMYYLLRIMLLVEQSGIVNACWPLAWTLDKLFAIPKDPDYATADKPSVPKGIIDRKKSLGLPVVDGAEPLSIYQPEREFHVSG